MSLSPKTPPNRAETLRTPDARLGGDDHNDGDFCKVLLGEESRLREPADRQGRGLLLCTFRPNDLPSGRHAQILPHRRSVVL